MFQGPIHGSTRVRRDLSYWKRSLANVPYRSEPGLLRSPVETQLLSGATAVRQLIQHRREGFFISLIAFYGWIERYSLQVRSIQIGKWIAKAAPAVETIVGC